MIQNKKSKISDARESLKLSAVRIETTE